MKIRLLMLGKTRGPETGAILAEYVKRIGRSCPIEVSEVRNGEAALKKLDADRATFYFGYGLPDRIANAR